MSVGVQPASRSSMPAVNTKSTQSVATAVGAIFKEMFPRAKPIWQKRLFHDVDNAYRGEHPDYLPCDLHYHDLEHSLQAALCYAFLIAGRHRAAVVPRVTPRQFELGLAAALLHDVGYLKHRSDTAGTGAKYNYIHVLRSCTFAASYLPKLGIGLAEMQGVLGAINCTGPTSEVARMYFRDPTERMIGCAVATADYLGQMAATDYPDELPILYAEFEESYNYTHVPVAQRTFQSVRQMTEETPAFWSSVVLPKLDNSFQALYRFLADPYPHGRNAYLEAVEHNIAVIKSRAAPGRKKK